MPRRVNHQERRQEILEAVTRITVKGGIASATFREIAGEAGMSVRLIQYYFGSKADVLLATQQHVAALATARLTDRVRQAGDAPRDVLHAVLTSFVPTDEESRTTMLMFVALHTASLTDPTLFRAEARHVPAALQTLVAKQLGRAGCAEESIGLEAAILTAIVPSLSQAVLDGMTTPDEAVATIDYAIDRALEATAPKSPKRRRRSTDS